jgi:hypothetical protein
VLVLVVMVVVGLLLLLLLLLLLPLTGQEGTKWGAPREMPRVAPSDAAWGV